MGKIVYSYWQGQLYAHVVILSVRANNLDSLQILTSNMSNSAKLQAEGCEIEHKSIGLCFMDTHHKE